MKTVVLDDDPTGTQSATGVRVLLQSDADLLAEALRLGDSVYVQTNSRAIDEAAAVRLVARIRRDAEEAAARLGEDVQFVLRGDSTLRGHVFAETEVFLDGDAVMLFVPAFPDGGRTTVDGVHLVRIGDREVPAHETEYAGDPVFPFGTGVLADYVREKSRRLPVTIPLAVVCGPASGLAEAFAGAPAGSVLLPDAATGDDIRRIADAVRTARSAGTAIVVRSAAPLAAELAGVASTGLLPRPIVASARPALLACGSHTGGATAQLERVRASWGDPAVIDTAAALADPVEAGHAAAGRARRQLEARPLAVVTSERVRTAENNTLAHGEKVMAALTTAVRDLLPAVDVVVAKGGITSAEVARTGIGATAAYVVGQVLPGVSVWRMLARDGREITYVVVPGNVGGESTLTDVLDALALAPGDALVGGDVLGRRDALAGGDVLGRGDALAGGDVLGRGDALAGGDVLEAGDALVGGDVLEAGDALVGGDVLEPGDVPAPGEALARGDAPEPGDAPAPREALAPGDALARGDAPAPGDVPPPEDASVHSA